MLAEFGDFATRLIHKLLANSAYYYDIYRVKYHNLFRTIPKKLNDNLYEIDYTLNSKDYKIVIKLDKNYIHRIFKIMTKREKEFEYRTDDSDIRKYLGPNENCHNMSITPKMLGYYSIEITYLGEDYETITKEFINDDKIEI
jgi:hypothetical protein